MVGAAVGSFLCGGEATHLLPHGVDDEGLCIDGPAVWHTRATFEEAHHIRRIREDVAQLPVREAGTQVAERWPCRVSVTSVKRPAAKPNV